MPRTKHQLGNPEPPARPFTGREDFLSAFDRALEALSPDRHSVLVYHGVGGIGKTRLIRELRRRLREGHPEVIHARLNFRNHINHFPARALIRLRNKLRDTDGNPIPTPTFDIAFAVYWKLEHPHLPLAKSELAFLEEGEIAGDLISALADAPAIGLVAKIPRIIDDVRRAVLEWWIRRGKEELASISTLDDPLEVAGWLPVFWSADVKAWLEDHPSQRVVLFLDTYEALWEGESEGTRGAPPDDWVRDWAGHLEGVLLVIGGRSKLRWAKQDKTWKDLIEQRLIGGLSPEESESLLEIAGVEEEEVRAIIVEQSEGVPLYLALAVDTYERIREAEGRTPRRDEFDENLDKLLARFLHYLDKAEKAALFKLSVPETFDRERFRDLMQTFGTGYPATADGLSALKKFSFLEEPERGRYALHALVRDALKAQDDPQERWEVHLHLFKRAEEALQGIEVRAITDGQRWALHEGFVHGQEIMEPKEFLAWCHETERPFEEAAEGRLLLALRRRVLSFAEQALGKEHPDTLAYAVKLAETLYDRGRYKEAEPYFREACKGLEMVLGEKHPNTLSAKSRLAMLLKKGGHYGEAEKLHQEVLEGYRQTLGEENRDTLLALNNLAEVLRVRGHSDDCDRAKRLFWRALKGLEQECGENHPDTLLVANNLALLLDNLGQHNYGEAELLYQEAESLYQRALQGHKEKLGDRHPATLTVMNNLADLLRRRGRYDDAEPLSREAFERRRERLGEKHPDTLSSANNLALLLRERGRENHEEAELLFKEALRGLKQMFVENHPNTLSTMENLACLLIKRGGDGDYGEAEALLREALKRREQHLGEGHPHIQAMRKNLEKLLRVGRRSEDSDLRSDDPL